MIVLPQTFRTRTSFSLAGAGLGAVFAMVHHGLGTTFPDDQLPGWLGAMIGGAGMAALIWPKRHRPAGLMIGLGVLVMIAAVLASNFSVGFFSDREISARAAGGIGNWLGSFFGSWIMAAFIGFFHIIAGLFVILLPGVVAGWLFRDPKGNS